MRAIAAMKNDDNVHSGRLGPTWSEVIPRELNREERAAIKKLVISECANYSRDYGCLPIDGDCVMIHKCWTGGGCKYFRNAVLPLDPILQAALTNIAAETRQCAVCGAAFTVKNSRQAYCSAVCAGKAQRKRNRDHMRKKRAARG